MHTEPKAAPSAIEAAAHEVLVTSLRNTHALEKQAIAVLQAQLKSLTDYPELHARVTLHIVETRDQARRLEAGLEACGASSSMLKDALLSVMGLGQSSVQAIGDDAVLKAVLADSMTEHLEIATYRMLLALADLAGKPELRPRLEETLHEEEEMAKWLDLNLEDITRQFVERKAADEQPTETDTDPQTADGEAQPTLWQTLEAASASSTPDTAKDGPPAPDKAHAPRPFHPHTPQTDDSRPGG
jgi:ferritin-like metal-binding protein YciE